MERFRQKEMIGGEANGRERMRMRMKHLVAQQNVVVCAM